MLGLVALKRSDDLRHQPHRDRRFWKGGLHRQAAWQRSERWSARGVRGTGRQAQTSIVQTLTSPSSPVDISTSSSSDLFPLSALGAQHT